MGTPLVIARQALLLVVARAIPNSANVCVFWPQIKTQTGYQIPAGRVILLGAGFVRLVEVARASKVLIKLFVMLPADFDPSEDIALPNPRGSEVLIRRLSTRFGVRYICRELRSR